MYNLVRFAPRLANYNPAEELVLLVDRQNNPIGSATRKDMRLNMLLHRSTYVFVRNSIGQFYVQMRTATKDFCPSHYDVATGGVVSADDPSDEISARRELQEEIGIKPSVLDFCMNYYYEDEDSKIWCAAFKTVWDGELVLQPEEVQWIELMTVEEIFSRSRTEKFCPDALEVLSVLLKNGSIQ